MPTVNAQTLALQLERVKANIPLWFAKDSGLYSLIKAKADVEVVSSRALRVPIKISNGGGISQVVMDGSDDLGIGSSANWDFATVSPLFFCKSFSLSKLAEYATDSDTKSIENATKRMITDATDQMLNSLEALLNSDGSGTLGVVASITGAVVTLVGNANQFSIGSTVQVFPSLGGTSRGNATITGLNANAKTITFATGFPSGTAANDILVVAGAPGTAASSLFGVGYVNSSASTGNFLGLSRTTYPQLRSNHISGGNAALTVNQPRLLINQIRKTLGVDAGNDLVFHCGPDQSLAWESLAVTQQRIDLQSSKRDSSMDFLAESAPVTMAGRKIVESVVAQPGRIDALALKTWGRAEIKPIGLLDYGGQNLFPSVASSGGLSSQTIGYLISGQQIYSDSPLAQGYIDSLSVATGA